ncbi:MAG: hypothetical protein LUC16_01505, partial [Coprobacillus sp.]|nr:hypothetical protein [Coprobacillus sp.]
PGMLKKHYSPNAQLVLLDDAKSEFPALFDKSRNEGDKEKIAFVAQRRLQDFANRENFFWLSESGDPADVARSLFSLLRKLDASKYEKIFVEKSPNDGIGAAINDRLSRASHQGHAGLSPRFSPSPRSGEGGDHDSCLASGTERKRHPAINASNNCLGEAGAKR